jgi:hypothetical protein
MRRGRAESLLLNGCTAQEKSKTFENDMQSLREILTQKMEGLEGETGLAPEQQSSQAFSP